MERLEVAVAVNELKEKLSKTSVPESTKRTKVLNFVKVMNSRQEHKPLNRPFATNDHMVHGGGQAHYYSRTGTLKQRDLKQ